VVDKVALGQVFSEYFVSLANLYSTNFSTIIRGWYNRPVVAAVPKVPPHKLKRKIINYSHFPKTTSLIRTCVMFLKEYI
jgi:hypothetical protein